MPPLPRLRIAVLDDLAKQLRFAPMETSRRHLERARQMAPEIDPTINYPEDWIIYRITGYRPQIEDPATIVGEALLFDVSALVERLSAAAGIREAELDPAMYMDAQAVCQRWNISRKTLDRYRRAGLLTLRVLGTGGRPRLLFPAEAVQWFEGKYKDRLSEAQGFERIGSKLEERMVQRAERYARAGLTLNQAAARIARRYGRGHETVRQVLRRSTGVRARFGNVGPPTLRERRLTERAYWLWFDPSAVAKHLGRSRVSIHRVIVDGRVKMLRELILPDLAEAARASSAAAQRSLAEEAILSASAVRSGLGERGETDVLEFVQAAKITSAPDIIRERSIAAAYQVLVVRAASAIAGLPAHSASAILVDRIETDLRWAARLKAALVRSQLGQLVRTFESSLERPLEDVRTSLLVPLIKEGIAALGQAVDSFDPRRGGRLAAPAGLALNRVMVQRLKSVTREVAGSSERPRASARLLTSSPIADWTRSVAPWQQHDGRHWLEPDGRVRAGLGSLAESERELLVSRFGWSGPPLTHVEIAEQLETTSMRIAQMERRIARRAIEAARRRGGRT